MAKPNQNKQIKSALGALHAQQRLTLYQCLYMDFKQAFTCVYKLNPSKSPILKEKK